MLKTKTLSSISITELTNKAGVSRMAYYRNFDSKEEIFSSYLDIILTKYGLSHTLFLSCSFSSDNSYNPQFLIHFAISDKCLR